jgi:hypothetical protein
VIIKPSQVRLNPGTNNLYIWKIILEKEEHFSIIFSKNLNDYSIGVYRELCDKINEYFKTLPSDTYSANAPNDIISICERKNYPKSPGVSVNFCSCNIQKPVSAPK